MRLVICIRDWLCREARWLAPIASERRWLIDARPVVSQPEKMAKQKRDNGYYLGRMEEEAPTVFARYKSGEFKSETDAILASRLRGPPKAIHALNRAWKSAGPADRAAFLVSIGAVTGAGSIAVVARASGATIANPDRTLTVTTRGRIKRLYPEEPFPCGVIMRAIGFKTLDASLGRAMTRGSRISQVMIDALTTWLPAEEARRI